MPLITIAWPELKIAVNNKQALENIKVPIKSPL